MNIFRVSELEESLDVAHKDLIKSEEVKSRMQKDCQEVGVMNLMFLFPTFLVGLMLLKADGSKLVRCRTFFHYYE